MLLGVLKIDLSHNASIPNIDWDRLLSRGKFVTFMRETIPIPDGNWMTGLSITPKS